MMEATDNVKPSSLLKYGRKVKGPVP